MVLLTSGLLMVGAISGSAVVLDLAKLYESVKNLDELFSLFPAIKFSKEKKI